MLLSLTVQFDLRYTASTLQFSVLNTATKKVKCKIFHRRDKILAMKIRGGLPINAMAADSFLLLPPLYVLHEV